MTVDPARAKATHEHAGKTYYVALGPRCLPQGAPTSPALTNVLCLRMDQRIAGLVQKLGWRYSRYADDLTFSFPAMPEVRIGRFFWWVDAICQEEGFLERPDKRRVLRRKHQQRVTGLVVNAGVHVPRADRKRFRAILHNCKKHGVAPGLHTPWQTTLTHAWLLQVDVTTQLTVTFRRRV